MIVTPATVGESRGILKKERLQGQVPHGIMFQQSDYAVDDGRM